MQRKRTRNEQQWFKIRKAAVAAIRMKHSMRAEDEINDVIPELQQRYEDALKGGPAFELETADLMKELS